MHTIQSFFCLKSDRSNFDLDPAHDGEFLFGEKDWADDVDKRLQRSIVMGRPHRHVWWGQYGIGKTHRLRFTKKLIESKQYAFYPCYAVASDLDDKSGFERLHLQLVSAIGFDVMRKFAEAYMLRIHNNEPVASIGELADACPDTAAAVQNLGSKNPNVAAAAWRYLSGQKLDRQDALLANTSKPQVDTALEFATVHHVFGHIIEKETGKKLLYLIDEAENLTKIKNKNAAARWQESIRAMLDIKNVGVVFAVGAENQQGIPSIIIMPDIVRRIQRENYEQMSAFKAAVADKFLRDLLKTFIEPACRPQREQSNGWSSGSGDYDADLYPFTKSAFQTFCNNATNDPRNAKPSEIINALNNAAYEALTTGSELITPQILSRLNMN